MNSILDDLKVQHDKLKQQLKIIERTITDLEMVYNGSPKEEPDSQTIALDLETPKYKPTWTMILKIKFFFQRERRFLHASELAQLINEKEPDKNINTRQVSIALNRLFKDTEKDDARILNFKYSDDRRNTFWGLSTWLTADGSGPKQEHMYEKSFLWENRKEEISIE